MSNFNISQVVEEMKSLALQTKTTSNVTTFEQPGNKTSTDFSKIFMNQIDKINEHHLEAGMLQEKFSLGDPSVTLPQVMIASQKSGLYTEFLIETRNKVVSAYNDIMNMSV